MTDSEIQTLIRISLKGRTTAISSAAILNGIRNDDPDYERGRQLIWQMVEAGEIVRKKITSYLSKPNGTGYSFINVYKLAGSS